MNLTNFSTEMLEETFFLDFNSQEIIEFSTRIDASLKGIDLAQAIYTEVRDAFLYDPFHLDLRKEKLQASSICKQKRAWCVEKAIVCCALFRKFGFPAKLGFGIVLNHIGVEKLVKYLKRDEIVFHGFVEVYVDGVWSKCTPAFDSRVCRLNKVVPLEWDGKNDSLLHAFSGVNQFMEYIHFYGSFTNVPLELMHDEMKKFYPHLFLQQIEENEFSFHFENQWKTLI